MRAQRAPGLPPADQLLFIEHEAVQMFDLTTGEGQARGTATGKVSGTTSVQFSYAPAGPPQGDIDGDQLFYDADGTGSFHLGSAWTSMNRCPYRAVATNQPSGLGTAYVELSKCD